MVMTREKERASVNRKRYKRIQTIIIKKTTVDQLRINKKGKRVIRIKNNADDELDKVRHEKREIKKCDDDEQKKSGMNAPCREKRKKEWGYHNKKRDLTGPFSSEKHHRDIGVARSVLRRIVKHWSIASRIAKRRHHDG